MPTGYLAPGYFLNGTAAEQCPSGSIAPGVRALNLAGPCTLCPAGFDTAGLKGQTECQGDSVRVLQRDGHLPNSNGSGWLQARM